MGNLWTTRVFLSFLLYKIRFNRTQAKRMALNFVGCCSGVLAFLVTSLVPQGTPFCYSVWWSVSWDFDHMLSFDESTTLTLSGLVYLSLFLFMRDMNLHLIYFVIFLFLTGCIPDLWRVYSENLWPVNFNGSFCLRMSDLDSIPKKWGLKMVVTWLFVSWLWQEHCRQYFCLPAEFRKVLSSQSMKCK